MAPDISNYVGREQAYVKHYFLEKYLERLIFKTSSVFEEVVYVDGFSGPWQNKGQRFEDTSFGIALAALTKAKETWAAMANPSQRRQLKVAAHLVEKDKAAFGRLSGLQSQFPAVDIRPYHGDFMDFAPDIAKAISPRAFSFVLIDPKGWSVDLQAIQPLIGRPNCEVVFNFMFDFINRFALLDDATIAGQLDRLIPARDWRARIRAIDQQHGASAEEHRASDARKGVLVEEFKAALADVGNYRFVSDIDVMRPKQDRTIYFLVYATRRPPGMDVFRDCHIASLEEQSKIRGERKLAGRQERSGQLELLASTNDMGPDRSSVSLPREEQRARQLLLDLTPLDGSTVRWDAVWPVVLSRCVIRLKRLKEIANEYRKSGALVFPNWPAGAKRTPEDDYVLHSGGASGSVQTALL